MNGALAPKAGGDRVLGHRDLAPAAWRAFSLAGSGIWRGSRWGLWIGVLVSLGGIGFGLWHITIELSGNLAIGSFFVAAFGAALIVLLSKYAPRR